MTTCDATGWAVIDNDKIDLRTVSPTRRAAIVNFLAAARCSMIYSDTTDDEIEREWLRLKRHAEVDRVKVGRIDGENAHSDGGKA